MNNNKERSEFHTWSKVVSALVVLPGLVAGIAVAIVAAPTIFEKMGGVDFKSAEMIWLMALTVGAWVMVVAGVCSVLWLVLVSFVEASIMSLCRKKQVSKVGALVGDFQLVVEGDAVAKGLNQDRELVFKLVREYTAQASKQFLVWMDEKEKRETEEWLRGYQQGEDQFEVKVDIESSK